MTTALAATARLGWRPTVQPMVGIVIVNYRTPDMTIECCKSLRRLNYDNLRIIVVDNASGDDSAEKFRMHLPDCHLVVATENGGYTAGNNLGIEHALALGAEYVHVLNPDTLLLNPDYLAALVQHLQENPDVGAVGPRVYLRSVDRVQNTVLRFPWLWRRMVDWCRSRVSTIKRRSNADILDA